VVEALTAPKVDAMIGYCSGRQHVLQQLPHLSVVQAPQDIAAGANASADAAGPTVGRPSQWRISTGATYGYRVTAMRSLYVRCLICREGCLA
jgi:hypothetical protein